MDNLLSSDEITLKKRIIAYVRGHLKQEPSVGFLIRKFKLNRVKFYKLFPGRKQELYRLAGSKKKIDNSIGTALVASRVMRPQIESVSAKERYNDHKKKFEEDVNELSYEARLRPEMTWLFASKVIPLVDPILWNKVLKMSNHNPQRAFQEAIDLSGDPYTIKIMADMVQGITPDDSFQKHASWMREIIEEWFVFKVSQKAGSSLPPGRAGSNCTSCQRRLYLAANGSITCKACNSFYHWSCAICDRRLEFGNINGISCRDCGFRILFDIPLIPPTRNEVEREPILRLWRNEFGVDHGKIILEHSGEVYSRDLDDLADRRRFR